MIILAVLEGANTDYPAKKSSIESAWSSSQNTRCLSPKLSGGVTYGKIACLASF